MIFRIIDFTEASKSFIYNFLRKKAAKNEKTIIVLTKSTDLNFRTLRNFSSPYSIPFKGLGHETEFKYFAKNKKF